MGFWDSLLNTFKKGVSTVAKKTDEYTKIGKIKVDIIGLKRDLDKQRTELGSRVYQLIAEENSTKIAADAEVQELINKIKDLNERIDQKREELERVREEYAEKTGKPIDEADVEPEQEAKG